jgi:excisionase family DNA binding protein
MQNNDQNTHPTQLYGISEAARHLALSERQLRIMIKNGSINFVRIGKRLLISLAQLNAFIKEHQH